MVRKFAPTPLPVLCADAFLAYLAVEHVGVLWPFAWFTVGACLQFYRLDLARAFQEHPPPSAKAAIDKLTFVAAIIGIERALILPVYFIGAELDGGIASDAAFLATMVFTGVAAGGVASAAGNVRVLAIWGAPSVLVLVGGWLHRGGIAGVAVALLILLLFAILTAYVRDQHRVIAELVHLVDDREALLASLESERDRAESASEAKTRFFAAASHDLRQPLHALAINATTLGLLSRSIAHPMLNDVSRGIDSALTQSQSLLDGLLDLSRLDAHAALANPQPFDLSCFLREICDEFRALAKRNLLDLELVVSQPSPWCHSDPDHLRRIVNNLVGNALKFTREGAVILRAHDAGTHVSLEVADTGPGVAPEERDKVFEEFYQSGNPSRDRSQGLGLGLAIVKRTCALLGIDLKLVSTLGQGTTIALRIPRAEPPLRSASAEATVLVPEDETAELPLLSALVIDDEAQIVEAVTRYLSALGWNVRSASSGDEALQVLAEGFAPEVVVVDYRLRVETGLEVIERLRERLPGLPAVIITGDTAPQRLKELKAQASVVLHKPLDGERLAQALTEAADKRR